MAAALELQRSAPAELEAALRRMSRTLAQFAAACIDAGVDGIFYATTTANAGQASRGEHERFQRPFDLDILDAAKGGWANILHLCGHAIQAPWFAGYPAPLVSWAATPGNPTFDEMRALTGKTLLAGMPGKPAFAQMSAEELKQHVRRSLAATGGVGHVLGPDCSINPGTPEALIDAAFEPVRSFRPQRG
jgi:uroporphyrinogen decarboxylase